MELWDTLHKTMFPAPPYAEGRRIVNVGATQYDVVPIRSLDCWRQACPAGEVDWGAAWKRLWQAAGATWGTGTDFRSGQVVIEIEAYFDNGEMSSIGVACPSELDEEAEWESSALRWLGRACGSDEPVVGCIGLVVDGDDERARPCLTLMVSGPGGAEEATMVIRQALANLGLTAGIAMRTVRNGSAGVVKVPFLPELYLVAGHSSYGIDWALWSEFATSDPPMEWAYATLLWCDTVIAAVAAVVENAPLMVDEVYFDYMRTVPLGPTVSATDLLFLRRHLGPLMRSQPHEFLFGQPSG